jgi:hypothetical protein
LTTKLSTPNREFKRSSTRLNTKTPTSLYALDKPEGIPISQAYLNSEKLTKENTDIAKKSDILNQPLNTFARKPSEKSLTSIQTGLESKRSEKRFLTNKHTSKMDFMNVLDKQEVKSKEETYNTNVKKNLSEESLNKSNSDSVRVFKKRFSDVGRQPILKLDKIPI